MVDYPSNSPISGVTFTSDPRLTALGVPAGGNYAAGLSVPPSGGASSLPAAVSPAAGTPVPPADVPSNLPYSAPSTTVPAAPARLAGGPEAGLAGFEQPFEGDKLSPAAARRYASGHVPAAIRLNNMGAISNVRGWGGQVGSVPRPSNEKRPGEANTYAVFATPELGIAASVRNLQRNAAQGRNTLGVIFGGGPKSWAADSAGYVGSIQRFLPGVDANTPLDLNDPHTLKSVLMGISAHESGFGAPVYQDSIYDWGVATALDPNYRTAGPRPSAPPSRTSPAAGAEGGRRMDSALPPGATAAPGAARPPPLPGPFSPRTGSFNPGIFPDQAEPRSVVPTGRSGEEQRALGFAKGLRGRFESAAPGPTGGGLTPSELTATDAFGQAQGAGPGVAGAPVGESQPVSWMELPGQLKDKLGAILPAAAQIWDRVSRGTSPAAPGSGRFEGAFPESDRFGGAFRPGDEAAPPDWSRDASFDQPPVVDIPVDPSQRHNIHVVQPGDNLWTIAGGDPARIREIARTNGIRNPSLIRPGQVLAMPAAPGGNVPQPRPDQGAPVAGGDPNALRANIDAAKAAAPPTPGGYVPTPASPGRGLSGQGSTYDPQRASDLGGGGSYASNLAAMPSRGTETAPAEPDAFARAEGMYRDYDRAEMNFGMQPNRPDPLRNAYPSKYYDKNYGPVEKMNPNMRYIDELAPGFKRDWTPVASNSRRRPSYAELLRGGYA